MNSQISKRKLVTVRESPVHFITLNREKCVGCGNCTIVCGMDLWRLSDGKAVLSRVYRQYCTECASCYTVCDFDAIEFTFPPGGHGVVYMKG